ncbi:MAG: acyltransferase [Flavitalea sp.]
MKADNRYISYLDGFRGYAIFFVVLAHLHLSNMNVAFLGVNLFFFVSGFLITKLLIHEVNKKQRIDLKAFYIRRLLRLYPALIVMILLSLTIILINHYEIIWKDIMAGLFYFTNYFLVYSDFVLPDQNYLLVSRILWSLSVEEHFYLIFPLLFVAFYPMKGYTFAMILVALIVMITIGRVITYIEIADKAKVFEINYYTTHSRADSILFGCLSAILIYRHDSRWYLKISRSKISILIGVILIVLSLVITEDFFKNTFRYTVQCIGFALVIPSFSYLKPGSVISRFVDNPVANFVGRLSYSIYLFHWVALKAGNIYFAPKSIVWLISVVLFTTVLSITSYYLVEMPFVSLRKKFGSNA